MDSPFQLRDQKILITGASGFLGTHLCRRLSKSGAEVHAVSRTQRSSNEECLQWWQGDLGDIGTVRNLLAAIKPDLIFHLSSHGKGAPSLDLVLPTLHSDLITTVNLLTAAAELGLSRIVLTGSLEEPETDNTEVSPSSPYAAAKWAGTAYARMFHQLYRLPVVIVRPFMTYGPGQPPYKLIPYVILSLLQGQAPKLTSGNRRIDWIYVDDVVDGFLAAARVPNVEGCTMDLGSGTLVPIREVVNYLVNLMHDRAEPVFGTLPERPVDHVRMAKTANTYVKLGWKPSTSLGKGLRETVDWYKTHLKDYSAL